MFFYAGAFLNNNDDPLAPVANEGQGILHCKPTPPSALLLFIDFPKLPYLINADDFVRVNALPPRSLYAQGTRDVGDGGSGNDSSLHDKYGSSEVDLYVPPVDVFINGELQSPIADRLVRLL